MSLCCVQKPQRQLEKLSQLVRAPGDFESMTYHIDVEANLQCGRWNTRGEKNDVGVTHAET